MALLFGESPGGITDGPAQKTRVEGQSSDQSIRSMVVRLPERPDIPLHLVVIRGFGTHPILLLTNVPPLPDREHAAWIADVYLTRWKCEEAHRFMKQSYQLEDVRVRSYVGLRNLYVLVHAVMYFVSVILGARAKLSLMFKKLCEKALRFYAVPAFFHYAVADAIHRLFFGSPTGPQKPPPAHPLDQLRLCFARPPSSCGPSTTRPGGGSTPTSWWRSWPIRCGRRFRNGWNRSS